MTWNLAEARAYSGQANCGCGHPAKFRSACVCPLRFAPSRWNRRAANVIQTEQSEIGDMKRRVGRDSGFLESGRGQFL